MSMNTLLKRKCKQVAVYWGNPKSDGEGGKTFNPPIEVFCRWEDKVQFLRDDTTEQQSSRAIAYTLVDVDEEGWMWLGRLSTLSDEQKADPKLVDGAQRIKKFEKSPGPNVNARQQEAGTGEYMRKAWLTPLLT